MKSVTKRVPKAIKALETNLSNLSDSEKKFAKSLVEYLRRDQQLTEVQWSWVPHLSGLGPKPSGLDSNQTLNSRLERLERNYTLIKREIQTLRGGFSEISSKSSSAKLRRGVWHSPNNMGKRARFIGIAPSGEEVYDTTSGGNFKKFSQKCKAFDILYGVENE